MTRTERTYYLVFGAYTLAAYSIAPVYPLFLLSRGLDLFEINVVLATYLITVFVFEVPTGAVADRAGRKRSFLLSCLLRAVAYGLYARAEGLADCLVAEVIDAIGTTLASGALEAWAVDGARAEGERRPPDRMLARGQVVARAAMIVGGIAYGYLAEAGWTLPWLASTAGFLVTALGAGVLMHEPSPAGGLQPLEAHASVLRALQAGLGTVARTPLLRGICLLSLLTACAAFPLHMLWQPWLRAVSGADLHLMGWVWAFLSLASLAGSALVPRLLQRLDRARLLGAAFLWRATMLAAAAAATSLAPALGGLILQEIAYGLSDPVLAAWMNEQTASAERATVLSVRSAFLTLGGGIGLVSIGLLGRAWGMPAALGACAAIFALTAPGFIVLGRVARRLPTPAPAEIPPLPEAAGRPVLG